MNPTSLGTSHMIIISALLLCSTLTALSSGSELPIYGIRMQDGDSILDGFLAVETHANVWKPVCYTNFTLVAEQTCRYLGFVGVPMIRKRAAPEISTGNYYGPATLQCDDNSSPLIACKAGKFWGICEQFSYLICDSTPMSCARRCGGPSTHYSCGCDEECSTFGDCCTDVAEECPNAYSPKPDRKPNITSERAHFANFTKCVTTINHSHRTVVWQPTKFKMVVSCPHNWSNDGIAEKCLSDGTTDYFSLLPVHNEAGVLFKNTYCALCHGTDMDKMVPWQLVQKDTERYIFPSRNVWGSFYDVCDHGFATSCSAGSDQTLADKCERFVQPVLFSPTVGAKNRYCYNCSTLSSTLKQSPQAVRFPVTFDVVFGVKSWSSLRSTCRNTKLHEDEIFHNTCPLFSEIQDVNQPRTLSLNHENCVSQLLSEIYPTPIFEVSTVMMGTHDKQNNTTIVLLPNVLSAFYLESTINKQLISPRCGEVDLRVRLLIETTAPCHYRADNNLPSFYVDSDNQSFHNIFSIRCNTSCSIVERHKTYCRDLDCQWEDEILPMINFRINNFADIEIVHLHSGAVLTEDQFTFTTDREIHTCSEYLIGGWTRAAFYIQVICGPISLICIILMVIIHVVFPKLRNIYGFCIVSLLSMLFVALLLFMLTTVSQMVDGLAQVVVAVNHYAWLSAFAWMTVISFHVSHTFSGKFVANRMNQVSNRREPMLYALFAWGVPVPFFLTGVILHLCHCTSFYYANHWMSEGPLTILLFAVPAILLAGFTTLFFVIGISQLRRRQGPQNTENRGQMSLKHNYLVALRLFFIVGIPWVLFIIYVATRSMFWLPLLTLVNSLQGCFIFISFVTTRRVRALLREKFNSYRSSSSTSQYSKAKQTETDRTLDNLTPKMNRGVRESPSGTPPIERR